MLNKIIQTVGHLYCCLALFLTSQITELFETVVRKLVSVVSSVTGIQRKNPKPWIQMYSTEPVFSEEHILDERAMLSRSDFPIKPEDLIEKCKVLYYGNMVTENKN